MAGLSDPLNFVKAENYFGTGAYWTGPTKITSINKTPPTTAVSPDHWRAVNITFDDGTIAVIQFVRPTLFRVRYDPAVTNANDYEDFSSRVVVGKTTSGLARDLDEFVGITWIVNLNDMGDHWSFTSTVTDVEKRSKGFYKSGDGLKINLFKSPFRIQAVRTLTPLPDTFPIPGFGTLKERRAERVIWQTSPETFRTYVHPDHPKVLKNVILDIIKPGPAEYIGFGEQGGMAFMKKPTFMNYFNFDNMQYQQVYNHGPMDSREPLYHSDPFWIEVNSNPEHANVTAAYLDNYSQICLDFGKTNSGYIKVGTRFNAMDIYIVSADNVPEVVRLYTGIAGRPKLKPKYVLGNHQACYGYTTKEDCEAVIRQYRDTGIPLDGLCIDVDLQDGFRTFTTNDATFPNFKDIMTDFRNKGVKCSTNITPVISINDRPQGYSTLQELVAKGYYVYDKRYLTGTSGKPEDVRYVCYGGGSFYEIDPNYVPGRPDFGDNYNFPENFNVQNYGYHGGVSYGYGNGTAGYYPDLNRKEVREWWGQQYNYLMESGLEFVWQDMTTPAIHTSYGDMKGFPTRLLVSSDAEPESTIAPKEVLAIENWALFSYNLHKATFHGLDKLPSRAGKRNFILGRGSFSGAYRFAGLWTGDNASTWDFWRITVSQVLSVGLNGVSIAGSDMGGFEPAIGKDGKEEKYCSPELLIRWYSGSVLLPWFRNHYVGNKKNRKWFQEPYAYPIHWNSNQQELAGLKWLYYGVEKICKYYVELRYSLIQVLYDAMFENQLNGLPIARSMLLTDVQDSTFFNESQDYLDNQYVTGRDILVAPILQPKDIVPGENRDVYLPRGNLWYQSNLRPWDNQGAPLLKPVEGGSVINYTASIPTSDNDDENYKQYPYVVPMFIREGAIIPQVQVRPYVGDISSGPNHIKFNIYPGKDNAYSTYLDDGVSRDSAPTNVVRYKMKSKKVKAIKESKTGGGVKDKQLDPEAKGYYRQVSVKQTTSAPITDGSTRTITVETKHDLYDPARELGVSYTLKLWYPPTAQLGNYNVTVTSGTTAPEYEIYQDNTLKVIVITIKETIGKSPSIVITAKPQ